MLLMRGRNNGVPERTFSPRPLLLLEALCRQSMNKKDEGAVGPQKRNYRARWWGRARVPQIAQGLIAAPFPRPAGSPSLPQPLPCRGA